MYSTDQNPEPSIKKIAVLQLMLNAICEATEIDTEETRMTIRTKSGESLGEFTIDEALKGGEDAINYLKDLQA